MTDLNAGFKTCDNCGQKINIASFLMHEAFCLKNFIKCDICNKSYNKTLKNEHLNEFHLKIKCICGNLIDKYLLDTHKKENCSKRQVECQYCDLSLDSDKIDGHLVVCGSRTEMCEKCRKYVLLRDKFAHELSDCFNKEKTPRNSAGQRKKESINASRPSSSLTAFPCEFCNKQFIGFQQLIEHEVFCDSPDNEPSRILSNTTDHLNQNFEEMSLKPRGNELFDEVDMQSEFSLVPCELCDEYIDFNVFNEHFERCKGMLPSRNEGTSNPEARKSNNAKKVGNIPKTGAQAQASNQTSNIRFSENIRAPRFHPRVIPSRNSVSKSSKDETMAEVEINRNGKHALEDGESPVKTKLLKGENGKMNGKDVEDSSNIAQSGDSQNGFDDQDEESQLSNGHKKRIVNSENSTSNYGDEDEDNDDEDEEDEDAEGAEDVEDDEAGDDEDDEGADDDDDDDDDAGDDEDDGADE